MAGFVEAYTAVFKEAGGVLSPAAVVRPLPEMGGGYGVTAAFEIPAGQVVASVPEDLFLAASRARRDCHLPKSTPPIVSICIYLMTARLRCIECALQTQRLLSSSAEEEFPDSAFPQALSGLSLSHFQTQAPPARVKTPGGRRKDALVALPLSPCFAVWIANLPPQYDNLIGIHPNGSLHLQNTKMGAGGEDTIDLLTDEIVQNWKQEVEAYRSDLESYLFPLLGTMRYARKIAEEIRSWRNLGYQNVSLFPKMPPLLSEALEQRRKKLPSLVARTFRSRELLLQLFGWAYSTLMSRGFYNDAETWMMLPYVDYFNFSHQPNLTFDYEPKKGVYEFKTLLPVARGKEMLIRYGMHSDIELLLWYGFVLCRQPSVDVPEQPWTHQAKCCYVLSPLSDANGDEDPSSEWLEELIISSGLHTDLNSIRQFIGKLSGPTSSKTPKALDSCSISRNSISPGLYSLINRIAKWRELTPVAVLQSILRSELNSYWNQQDQVSQQEAPETRHIFPQWRTEPVLNMAHVICEDNRQLLQHLNLLSLSDLEVIFKRQSV